MKILLTGAAGFIGMHTAMRLLARGNEVIGIDNMNDYYDVSLKEARAARLVNHPAFRFHRMSVNDIEGLTTLFAKERPDRVVHLAAQAGVRYSLMNPNVYIQSNIQGFMNILECSRHSKIGHLVYASSSSVYGGNASLPFSEHHTVDHPVSLYAATKKSNELMAHTYSHLFGLPTTGLRFFTVYGPWGRPDMAPMLFAQAILAGRPIDIFNNGHMARDFTYVDDIVEGVIRVLDKPATPSSQFNAACPDPAISSAPYRIFNIGGSQPTPLIEFIGELERALGRIASKNYLPMQLGDVPETSADTNELNSWVGFKPHTPIREGVGRFVEWYKAYFCK
jgi:UDP-glucuronate 4-epimerase